MSERNVADLTASQDTTDPVEEVRRGGLRSSPPRPSPVAEFAQTASATTAVVADVEGTEEKPRRRPAQAIPVTNGRSPEAYREFRRACDELLVQISELESLVQPDGTLARGWEGAALEIQTLVLSLRAVAWGHGDALKRWVTALFFQVSNSAWDARHAHLLGKATRALRARYSVDDAAVEECNEIIKLVGLDSFRATVSQPTVLRRYKVVPDS